MKCEIFAIFCLLRIYNVFGATVKTPLDYDITCKDEDGNGVDWWVESNCRCPNWTKKWNSSARFYLYKLPGHFGEAHQSKGRLFMYFTSNSETPQWILSDRTVDDPMSIPGRTIVQAYFNATKVERLVVAYNDEPPNKKSNSKKGHLKGLLVADEASGFWLIHSVPLFPNITGMYSYLQNLLFNWINTRSILTVIQFRYRWSFRLQLSGHRNHLWPKFLVPFAYRRSNKYCRQSIDLQSTANFHGQTDGKTQPKISKCRTFAIQ